MSTANKYWRQRQREAARQYAAAYSAYMQAAPSEIEAARRALASAESALAGVAALSFLPKAEYDAMAASGHAMIAATEAPR